MAFFYFLDVFICLSKYSSGRPRRWEIFYFIWVWLLYFPIREYKQGRILDFFWRGCTRLFVYFNTNKPHSFFVFFFCRIPVVPVVRKPQVISGGGGVRTPCTLPLDTPLISRRCEVIYQILLYGESIFFAHSVESICQAKILLFGVNCRL